MDLLTKLNSQLILKSSNISSYKRIKLFKIFFFAQMIRIVGKVLLQS
jgi:hypothetical protein